MDLRDGFFHCCSILQVGCLVFVCMLIDDASHHLLWVKVVFDKRKRHRLLVVKNPYLNYGLHCA
jgi:hypothetical protein